MTESECDGGRLWVLRRSIRRPRVVSSLLISAFVTAVFFLLAGLSWADDGTPIPSPPPATPTLKIIQTAELVPALESLDAFLSAVHESLVPHSDAFNALEKELEEIRKDVDAEWKKPPLRATRDGSLGTLSRESLDEIIKKEQRFSEHEEKLSTWSDALSRTITSIISQREEIRERASIWQETLARLGDEGASYPIQSRVRESLKRLERATSATQSILDSLLLRQTNISAVEAQILQALSIIDRAKAQLRSWLFTRDASFLFLDEFRAWSEGESLSPLSALNESFDEIWNYIISHRELFITHCGLIAVLFLILRAPAIRRALPHAGLFLVLSGVLVSLFLYRDAPESFLAFARVLSMSLAVLFLSCVRESLFIPTAWVLVVLMTFETLRHLVREPVPLSQGLLVFELLLGAGLCLSVRSWSLKKREVSPSLMKHAFIQRTSRILAWIFTASAAAILAGYWQLGSLVGVTAVYACSNGLLIFLLYLFFSHSLQFFLRNASTLPLRTLAHHRLLFESRILKVVRGLCYLGWSVSLVMALGLFESSMRGILLLLAVPLTLGDSNLTISSVLIAVLLVVVGVKASALIELVLSEDVFPRYPWDRGVQHAITKTTRYGIWILAACGSLASLGVDVRNLAIVAGALSVGVAFGLQTVVHNFVSGLILLVERPVKPGDAISFGGMNGNVARIGLRSTTIRTPDEAELIVPNGSLLSEKVTNLRYSTFPLRMTLTLLVAADSDPRSIIELLKTVAEESPDIRKTPSYDIFFRGYDNGAFVITFSALVAEASRKGSIESDFLLRAYESFRHHGVKLPVVRREIHIVGDQTQDAQSRSVLEA